jgi:hypothetical protein
MRRYSLAKICTRKHEVTIETNFVVAMGHGECTYNRKAL